jgi:NADH-quinone oxidoreductase subunit N
MTVALLSLAGIPPLAGFFAKYLVFASAIENGYLGFVIAAVVASLIGVYYYFGIIKAIYSGIATDDELRVEPLGKVLFFVLLAAIVLIGIIPDPFISILGQ